MSPLNRSIVTIGLLSLSGMSFAGPSSSYYTDLGNCLITDSSAWDPHAEIDHFRSECPAIGGYQIFVDGGDSRSWLEVAKDGKRTSFSGAIHGQQSIGFFPNVGTGKLEWRYGLKDTAAKPYAIIFRVHAQVPETNAGISKLYVARLGGQSPCVVGVVSTNQEARGLADKLLTSRAPACLP